MNPARPINRYVAAQAMRRSARPMRRVPEHPRWQFRQAFGRLVRSATDRGVFTLLDRRAPSRLLSAFPAGVEVRRVSLAEAVAQTRAFLAEAAPARS